MGNNRSKHKNTPLKVVLGDDAHEESSVRLRLANSIAHRHSGISARGHGGVLGSPKFLEVIRLVAGS
jgi:hypothetical protein